jgi:RHS repeat-associated protein
VVARRAVLSLYAALVAVIVIPSARALGQGNRKPSRQSPGTASPLILCQSGNYRVSVTPDGATARWPQYTNGDSSKFTVTNTSPDCANSYSLSYTATAPISGVTLDKTNSGTLQPGYSTIVKATYNVGAAGSGTLTLHAAGQYGGVSDDGYYSVTAFVYQVAVTPDGGHTSRPAGTGGYSETFTVRNTGVAQDSYAFNCTGSSNVTCGAVTPASATLGVGDSTTVTVGYSVGGPGTGTLTLTASGGASDTGYYTINANPPPTVSLAPYNGGRRAASDFDGTVTHATPAYWSMGVARTFALQYNASTVRPTAIVRVDVMLSPSPPYPTAYGIQVQIVNGPVLTLLNGTQTAYYAAGSCCVTRLVAAVDAKANGLATGRYDVNFIVTSYFTGAIQTSSVATRLLVEDDSRSAFGAGWSAFPRIYPQGYSALLTQGDGSMSFFQRDSANRPFIAPPGDPTKLTLTTHPVKGTIYRRTNLDGSYVDFTTDGRMWRAVTPFDTATALTLTWTDTLLTSIRDVAGKTITLAYTGGKLQTATDPAGRVTRYAVDSLLRKITEANNDTTGFSYDGLKRLTTIRDNAGAATDLAYDGINQLASTTGPSFQDYSGSSVRSTVTLLSPDRHAWQPGIPGTSVDAPKLNPGDSLVTGSVVDPLGATTKVKVDRFGQPLSVTDAKGQLTSIVRDTLGQPTSIAGPNNHVTTFGYSGYLMTRQTDQSTGANVYYDYNSANMLITIRGDVTRTDIYYRPAYTGGPLNGPVDSVYSGNTTGSYAQDFGGTLFSRHIVNRWGQDSVVIDGQGHRMTLLYADTVQFGGPVQVIDPLGRIVAKYHYDNAGRVDTSWALAQGTYGATSQTYDPLNRTLSVKNALGYVTQSVYGTQGLSRVIDAKGQVYKFGRNALGMVVAQHDLADTTKADTLKYDVAGRVRAIRTRRGDLVSFTYDSATGNLLTRSGPDFAADSFRYDPLGRWVVGTNANAYDSLNFDRHGRLTTAVERLTGASTYTLSYGYDAQDREITRSAPTRGTNVRITYDPTKGMITRLCAAAACASPQGFDADYIPHTTAYTDTLLNPAWSRADTTNGAHLETSNGFINNTATPIGLSAFKNTWTYDSLGRVRKEGTSDYGPMYGYDAAGQLTSACTWLYPSPPAQPLCNDEYGSHTNGNSYGYDAAGNRIDPLASPVVGSGNRVLAFKGYSLIYDDAGNLIAKRGSLTQFGTDTSTFTWDALGRLTSVTRWPAGGAHTTVSFAYDALGRRVSKTVNGTTQWYTHDGDQVAMILDSLGQRLKLELGWAPGMDNLAFVRTPSWTAAAITTPQNGTLRGLASPTPGAPVRKQYSPSATATWGDMTADTGAVVPIRMGGAEYDQDTRLYYMRARYFDPQLGRFLSEDPQGIAGGLNLYTYAGNDPLNARDPSGLDLPVYELSPATVWGASPYVNYWDRLMGIEGPASPSNGLAGLKHGLSIGGGQNGVGRRLLRKFDACRDEFENLLTSATLDLITLETGGVAGLVRAGRLGLRAGGIALKGVGRLALGAGATLAAGGGVVVRSSARAALTVGSKELALAGGEIASGLLADPSAASAGLRTSYVTANSIAQSGSLLDAVMGVIPIVSSVWATGKWGVCLWRN